MNGAFGSYGQLPLYSQHHVGYGCYGCGPSYGNFGQEPVPTQQQGLKLATDIVSIVQSLAGQKSSYQLAAQLEAAKRRGAGSTTIAELEGLLKAARDSEAQAALWRTLGAAAIIGVIGLTAAASFALISRSMR